MNLTKDKPTESAFVKLINELKTNIVLQRFLVVVGLFALWFIVMFFMFAFICTSFNFIEWPETSRIGVVSWTSFCWVATMFTLGIAGYFSSEDRRK